MNLALIATARNLAEAGPRRPKQANLKRAISTAYYALFHAMARDSADLLVGGGQNRKRPAWSQVYRALEHSFAKKACEQVRCPPFGNSVVSCAEAFVTLQQARHDADYDPTYRVVRGKALSIVDLAENAIKDLQAGSKPDRKDFAVHLLFKKRT